MIDEKKLIEEIGEYMISVYGCDINDIIAFQTNNESKSAYIVQGICEAIDFIEEQPKVGEWIPCSVALPQQPEENPIFDNKPLELYLVSVKNADYPIRAFWNGKFFTDGWSKVDVIAWQPLPQPFQKGE